jgi:hypothetical protein
MVATVALDPSKVVFMEYGTTPVYLSDVLPARIARVALACGWSWKFYPAQGRKSPLVVLRKGSHVIDVVTVRTAPGSAPRMRSAWFTREDYPITRQLDLIERLASV